MQAAAVCVPGNVSKANLKIKLIVDWFLIGRIHLQVNFRYFDPFCCHGVAQWLILSLRQPKVHGSRPGNGKAC